VVIWKVFLKLGGTLYMVSLENNPVKQESRIAGILMKTDIHVDSFAFSVAHIGLRACC